MERLRRFLVASATMLALPLSSFAGYVDIVHDQHALDAYTANVAYVNITEDYHNKEIDKTRQKKEKIAKYHATMESIKELYKMSEALAMRVPITVRLSSNSARCLEIWEGLSKPFPKVQYSTMSIV